MTLPIASLVVTIGLVIVLNPDFIRQMAIPVPAPVTAPPARVTPTPAQKTMSLEYERHLPPESNQTPGSLQTELESPISVGAVENTGDWLRLVYPELVRIAELEQEPVDVALTEVVPMLDNDDPAIRLAVVESLGDMATQATLPALSTALSDPSPQIRIAALEALGSHDDASIIGNIEPLLYDPDREVRLAAIDTLADPEHKLAVNSLAGLLGDPDPRIRRKAVYSLGEIGGEKAMMYLQQARYDPDPKTRNGARAILAELEYELAD